MKNRPIKRFIRNLFPAPFILVRGLKLLYSKDSYLKQMGYTRSLKDRAPTSADGSPLPWMNYGVIQFLSERLNSSMSLLEFGSGYSTRFYAKKVGSVISIEHDKFWIDQLKSELPENATILHRKLDDKQGYCNVTDTLDKTFDVIVVDGRHRIDCMMSSLSALSDRGVVLLDDSSRDRYSECIPDMLAKGFRKLDFTGLKPSSRKPHSTTLFYRDNNCLGV